MSLTVNIEERIRTSASNIPAKVIHESKLRNISIMKMKVGDALYTIWELIIGYIFTSDGYAVETNDGYMVKCNDQ